MIITKGKLVEGAYSQYLGINGKTSAAQPEDISDGIDAADDIALMLENEGILLGWNLPSVYGESKASDDSGIPDWAAGPIKVMIADRMALSFGKIGPNPVEVNKAMHSLSMSIPDPSSVYPSTLPMGNAQQIWPYGLAYYPGKEDTLDTETDGTFTQLPTGLDTPDGSGL